MADKDSLVLLAREGTQAHHLPPDVAYADFLGRFLGSEKEAAYAATLTGDGVDASNNTGIWGYANGSHTLLLRAGDLAPGTTPGTVFSQVGLATGGDGLAVGGDEHLLITAALSGPGIDSTNDTGIWAEEAGGFRLVVQEGDAVPGRPAGETFDDLIPLGSSLRGEATFFTTINGNGGASAREIWSEVGGQLHSVARSGDPAPGLPDGNTLFLRDHNHVAVNSAGQVVFSAIVLGPDANGGTLWATDPTGELKLIAKRGDEIEVAPGDVLTIGDVDDLFDQGLGDVINDRGQIVFHAKFGLPEGIFVSDAVAIPEPTTMLILLCSVGALWTPRRRTPKS